ncbi:MAG: energy transducer TonB, partial [Pseudomonadota bacterium]
MNTKLFHGALLALLMTFAGTAAAQEADGAAAPTPEDDLQVNEAASLEELLDNVRERRVVESREHSQREQRFAQDKANQQQLLYDARAERRRDEQRSDRLETYFDENEIRIGD